MTITYHENFDQGSGDWYAIRCGLLTASAMKLIITPTLKVASNDKERTHLYELMAQRITKYVDPNYVSDDMLRGKEDEIEAKALYNKHYAETKDVGFVTNDEWGFTIGYSPDALVGDDGLLEAKSRRQKYQVETVIECSVLGTIPADYIMQVQTGLLVTRRKWLDFVTYCGGLNMVTVRVFPDEKIQEAIIHAATNFEMRLAEKTGVYQKFIQSDARILPTERRVEQEISVI